MESTMRQYGIALKNALMSRDKSDEIKSILAIKQTLENYQSSDLFVKVILDLDIHDFLLNHLISLKYPLILDILQCIKYLCSHKIYFEYDQAVYTAETILKSIFSQIKYNNHDDFLTNALELITTILLRLNDVQSNKRISFDRFVETAYEILTTKESAQVICAATTMMSALISYKPLIDHMNKKKLIDLENIFNVAIHKLSQIFQTDKSNAILATLILCDRFLRFSKDLLRFRDDKIIEFCNTVTETSIKCLQVGCIPYISEIGLKNQIFYVEYLNFLENLFMEINLSKEVLYSICIQLVTEKNFVLIAQNINIFENVDDYESKETIRQISLKMLCEIIVNINSFGNNYYSYNENEYKMHIFKGLQVTPNNVNDWLAELNNQAISIDSKIGILQFCCVYYVYSNNLQDLQSCHFQNIVTFFKEFPHATFLPNFIIKDLWLIFAAVYSSVAQDALYFHGMHQATNKLQRLILLYKENLDSVITAHPSIMYWACVAPYVKKELQFAVFCFWIMESQSNLNCRTALISTIKNCKNASVILLKMVLKNSPEYAQASTEILSTALEQGHLNKNSEFMNMLCTHVSSSITEISMQHIMRERVVNAIYMMQLGTYITCVSDCEMVQYSVTTFTNCIGAMGISDLLPEIFYIKAFEYTSGILRVAKKYKIKQVFTTFINSEPVLCAFTTALLSNSRDLAVRAGKIISNLLEYQNKNNVTCKKNLVIQNNSLIKLLSGKDPEQILLNLKIVSILLNNNAGKSILQILYPMDDKFIKGLYLRCLSLMCKPGCYELTRCSCKCLQAILKHSYMNKLLVYDYLCNHSGNHTLVMMYYDKETSRVTERSFLRFIEYWLRYASKNKERINNKLLISSIFWKMSLQQIAKIIIQNNNNSQQHNFDLIYSISNQLLLFSDILPSQLLQYLKQNIGRANCFSS